jgi:hypothetical protein
MCKNVQIVFLHSTMDTNALKKTQTKSNKVMKKVDQFTYNASYIEYRISIMKTTTRVRFVMHYQTQHTMTISDNMAGFEYN